MTEPLRERIAAAVATRLRTIHAGTVVYSDPNPPATVEYLTTPKAVTRSLLDPDQYPDPATQFPLLGVVRSSGSTLTRKTASVYEHHYILGIFGYVQGDVEAVPGAVLAATLLEELWNDVWACLRSNPTLNGLVLDCQPDGEMDTDDGVSEPLGAFRQSWRIHVMESVPVLVAA